MLQYSNAAVFLTPDGHARIAAELDTLTTVRRLEVAAEIGAAAEDGDLAENSAYEHAKDEQALLEGRIATLNHFLRHAVLITHPTSDTIGLGSTVTIEDEGEEVTYTIVGPVEAAHAKGRISDESPLGGALLAHKAGDAVQVETPAGSRRITVIAIT